MLVSHILLIDSLYRAGLITGIGMKEGKPILELPPKHVELVRLEFSEDERQVCTFMPGSVVLCPDQRDAICIAQLYEHMQRRAQVELNRFIRNGSVIKKCVRTFISSCSEHSSLNGL